MSNLNNIFNCVKYKNCVNNGITSILHNLYYFYILNKLIQNYQDCEPDSKLLNNKEQSINEICLLFNNQFVLNEQLLNELIIYIKSHIVNFNNIVNETIIYHINTENLHVIKDYIRYYNNQLLIKWIVDLSQPVNTDIILDANSKINSFYDEVKSRLPIDICDTNLFAIQNDKYLYNIQLLNNYFKYNILLNNNLVSKDILLDDVIINNKNTFDLIFLNMPTNIHNIIHANCCKKIKNLKLRGTKAEPLLLQLVMQSLNPNGRAVVIVPDSFLYNESIQLIETRQYLIKNFNIKKIVEIDETIHEYANVTKDIKSITSTYKKSIIYFENTGKTTNIVWSKIELHNNQITENIIDINVDINNLESNMYSLYYKTYINRYNKIDTIQFIPVSELFNIHMHENETEQSCDLQMNDSNINDLQEILGLTTYYKTNESIKIINKTEIHLYKIILYEKINESLFITNFLTHFLKYKIIINSRQFIKGKMSHFDINKIMSYKIPILNKETQQLTCNYLKITEKLINDNNNKIELYNNLIKYTMDTIPMTNCDTLDRIINIYQITDHNPINLLVGIIKNGLSAGTVFLPTKHLPTNSHFLILRNENQYLRDYVYYYLKYIETQIIELANLTTQPNLTKSQLLSLKIPKIDISLQKLVILEYETFNNNIIKCIESNNDIKERDILGTIIKLNNL
jgi:hypothetical protein